jgi:predicted flap endonuclease-1-like 5' DNA nuclease
MWSSQVDEEGFRSFLKRGGRSPSAVKRCLMHVDGFAGYLRSQCGGKCLDDADLDDLQGFVAWVEREPKASAKTHLWAIRYYYEYTANEEMHSLAGILRQQRIERKPSSLKDFQGVDPGYVAALAAAGIRNAEQMLKAGRTAADRQALARQTGVPNEAILELVKLSDLARIFGVKGVRARLYHDAGVDTVEKMARWDPGELRAMLVEFVERTCFEGIAPLPAEARFTVAQARRLPKVVETES